MLFRLAPTALDWIQFTMELRQIQADMIPTLDDVFENSFLSLEIL